MKQEKYVRDSMGRFSRFGKLIKLLFIILIVAGFVAFGGWVDSGYLQETYADDSESNAVPVVEVFEHKDTEAKLEEKIKALQNEVADKLKVGESSHYKAKPGEAFYTNDPSIAMRATCAVIGGKRNPHCDSWGDYQMKIEFIQRRYKELYGKEITEVDAILLALDSTKARTFAIEVFTKLQGSIWEWSSAKKSAETEAFFNQKITLIRELQSLL